MELFQIPLWLSTLASHLHLTRMTWLVSEIFFDDLSMCMARIMKWQASNMKGLEISSLVECISMTKLSVGATRWTYG